MDFSRSVFSPKVNANNFEGIITYINKNYPKEWDKYIKIEPSSTAKDDIREGALSIVNRTSKNDSDKHKQNWCSSNETLPYFILSIKSFFISPIFYSFQSRDYPDNYYPKSWFVQGSINKRNWINISEELGQNQMKQDQTATFSFQKYGIFKYIKFNQISDVSTKNYFCLQQIEIFGELLKRIPSNCAFNIFNFPQLLLFQLTFIVL